MTTVSVRSLPYSGGGNQNTLWSFSSVSGVASVANIYHNISAVINDNIPYVLREGADRPQRNAAGVNGFFDFVSHTDISVGAGTDGGIHQYDFNIMSSFEYPRVIPSGVMTIRLGYHVSGVHPSAQPFVYISDLWYYASNTHHPPIPQASGAIIVAEISELLPYNVTLSNNSSGVAILQMNVAERNRDWLSGHETGVFSLIWGFGYNYLGQNIFDGLDYDFTAPISDGALIINGMEILYSGELQPFTNNCNLYISGSAITPTSGNFPLCISGTTPTASLLLYLQGPIPNSSVANLPLNIYSSANSGLFKILPLVVGYQSGTPDRRNVLNLYTSGPSNSTSVSSLNLFLQNDNIAEKSLDLFLKNEVVINSGSIPLFMNAPSGLDGSVPISGSMNLFMSRQYEAVGNSLSMFVKCLTPESGNPTLFIEGNTLSSGNVPLYMHGVGQATEDTKLYTHGF